MKKSVDIVIISAANNNLLRAETEKAIDSLHKSESDVRFCVYVIESNHKVSYKGDAVKTVHPTESFGYHKYLNIGRKLGSSEFVCLCNNDLVFESGWASAIIESMQADPQLLSASPYCRHSHPHYGIEPNSGNIQGYQVRKLIPGWCIFQRRSIYKIIGDLDEQFIFWYADNDYSETIKHHNIKHQLITSAIVNHHTSRTLRTRPTPERRALTHAQKRLFNAKWPSNG